MTARTSVLLSGAVALLSACVPTPVPDKAGGVVELFSGGTFHGYRRAVIYPNDVVELTTSGPFDEGKKTRTRQAQPGAFQALRQHIDANPIPEKALASKEVCEDYGGEIVEMTLPDRSVKYLSSCPNKPLTTLYVEAMDVLTRHLPDS